MTKPISTENLNNCTDKESASNGMHLNSFKSHAYRSKLEFVSVVFLSLINNTKMPQVIFFENCQSQINEFRPGFNKNFPKSEYLLLFLEKHRRFVTLQQAGRNSYYPYIICINTHYPAKSILQRVLRVTSSRYIQANVLQFMGSNFMYDSAYTFILTYIKLFKYPLCNKHSLYC